MVINQNSWHYKVYKWTYFWGGGIPTQTNLCQYIRRFFSIPWWVFVAVFLTMMLGVIFTGAILFGPIFGYVPRTMNPVKFFDHNMRKYQGLNLGIQVYPWHVILLALLVWGHVAVYQSWGSRPLVVEGIGVGAGVGILAAIVGLLIYLDSPTGRVVNEYLAAKKQKVCPVVEFKSEE